MPLVRPSPTGWSVARSHAACPPQKSKPFSWRRWSRAYRVASTAACLYFGSPVRSVSATSTRNRFCWLARFDSVHSAGMFHFSACSLGSFQMTGSCVSMLRPSVKRGVRLGPYTSLPWRRTLSAKVLTASRYVPVAGFSDLAGPAPAATVAKAQTDSRYVDADVIFMSSDSVDGSRDTSRFPPAMVSNDRRACQAGICYDRPPRMRDATMAILPGKRNRR